MKNAKVFYTESGTDYYFIGYSPDEISEYILRHPPQTIRTSPTSCSRSFTTCVFSDVDAWNRFWRVLEMLKKKGLD